MMAGTINIKYIRKTDFGGIV